MIPDIVSVVFPLTFIILLVVIVSVIKPSTDKLLSPVITEILSPLITIVLSDK